MVKVSYDGIRNGSIYHYSPMHNRWFGDNESTSWWVRNIAPCILVQYRLTRMAIEQGHSEEIFRPKPKMKVKKVRTVKASKPSSTFVSLF
tara:strand:- start:609 stop:878 length:270 start_codon:yes stop_codon:yes gene_type:complete